MRFRDIRALEAEPGHTPSKVVKRQIDRTTFRQPREKTSPVPNRASRRANGQYRSHKRSAIRRAVIAAREAGHATPRDFLSKRGLLK